MLVRIDERDRSVDDPEDRDVGRRADGERPETRHAIDDARGLARRFPTTSSSEKPRARNFDITLGRSGREGD